MEAEAPKGLEKKVSIQEANFELKDLIGEKVWVSGYYGDKRFTGDGVAFLVTSFHLLVIDEQLPHHSFIRLDGALPPDTDNGAEILVYGEVKDFGAAYRVFTVSPTPLITVEKYKVITPSPFRKMNMQERFRDFLKKKMRKGKKVFEMQSAFAWGNPPQPPKPQIIKPCDRALIISGGVDANNNHVRYRDNMIAKFKKLKELGFTDAQIAALYNDGAAVNSDGVNIVDDRASKQTITDTLDRMFNEMEASCTLTIFVTDHGTGYNEGQGYHGARPAFAGERGLTYPENTFKVDAREKVYRSNVWMNPAGDEWLVTIDKNTNRMELHKKEGGSWVKKGEDANGNGRITESETNQDIDADGDKDEAGWNEADLAPWQHRDNEWDTDGDGTNDVRMRWDGARYVFERFKDAAWHEMGRDTNGDFVIDAADGGVDWDLDGNKNGSIGFHEGINLWGEEVLWDDEFANLLKRLADKGIHIVVEMVQCFGGGFVENLKGIVEKIVTGAGEDTKHWNRIKPDGTAYAADEMAFVDNLEGIDLVSWNKAFDKAVEADRQKWVQEGSDPVSENDPQRWEKPLIETGSRFTEENGTYTINLKIPQNLQGTIYDIEILFGLQIPRWDAAEVITMPEGCVRSDIPGGIRIEHAQALVDDSTFEIKGKAGAGILFLHLTDNEHKNLGNTPVRKVYEPVPPVRPDVVRRPETVYRPRPFDVWPRRPVDSVQPCKPEDATTSHEAPEPSPPPTVCEDATTPAPKVPEPAPAEVCEDATTTAPQEDASTRKPAEDVQHKHIDGNETSHDATIVYSPQPDGGMHIDAAVITTGDGFNLRKWVVDDVHIEINGDRVRPSSSESIYIEKDSYFRGAATATFVALGLQGGGHGGESGCGSGESACGDSCSTAGGDEHGRPSSRKKSGIERAGIAAGMGLLAGQARGHIKGKKASFNLNKEQAGKLLAGKARLSIKSSNADAHKQQTVKMALP
ncbi:MAG: hypothetical protein ABIH01_03755 [Candidatus Omnitrophota bacterium]